MVFEVWELFGCLLGTFLGLPRLYWTASDPKNLESSNVVCKVCENAGCQEVETFDGSLGPSWADLIPKCNPKVIKM